MIQGVLLVCLVFNLKSCARPSRSLTNSGFQITADFSATKNAPCARTNRDEMARCVRVTAFYGAREIATAPNWNANDRTKRICYSM